MAHAIPPDSPPPSPGTTSAAPPPSLRGALPSYTARLVVSLLLGAGLAWLLVRGGLPLVPAASAFSELRLWTVPAYVGSLALVHYFRAARWRYLLRPIGHVPMRSVLAVSWIAFAIILLSPLRTGEVVRPYLVSRRGPVKLWEAAGTVGAERIIDGLILSVILFVSLRFASPLDPLPDHIGDLPVPAAAVPGAAYTVLALFSVAFAMMALFFLARDRARHITLAVVGVISERLAARVAAIVERVAEGLRFLPSSRHLVPFLLETMAYWGINAAGVWLLGWGTGLSGMTFIEACVTMGCIGIGILVPSGPGFFGAFQLSTYMALAMYFPEELLRGPGAAFVFLLYVTQVGWHLIAAAIGVALDGRPRPEPAH